MAEYCPLDFVVEVLEAVRLGHEIILKATSAPTLLALYEEEVECVVFPHGVESSTLRMTAAITHELRLRENLTLTDEATARSN